MKIIDKLSNLLTLKSLKIILISLGALFIVKLCGSFILKNLDFINSLYFFKTNLFDFIIFVSILAIIWKNGNFDQKFEQAKLDVVATIDDSTKAKDDSVEKLHTIEESISHIEEEIDSIIQKSEENANLIGEKILADAEKNTTVINDNAEKTIENSVQTLRNDLIKRASLASVEIARNQIINELKDNLNLHNKLIDESLNAIEGVELK